MSGLLGKTIVVTGAGAGIGQGSALFFAREGALAMADSPPAIDIPTAVAGGLWKKQGAQASLGARGPLEQRGLLVQEALHGRAMVAGTDGHSLARRFQFH